MIRVLRLPKKVLSAEAEPYVAHAALWREEILANLGSEIASLLPEVDLNEEYVSFLTALEGSLETVSEENLTPQLKELVQGRRSQLISYLTAKIPLQHPELEPHRQAVATLFARSCRLYLMDKRNPLLLPCLTEEELAKAQPAAVHSARSGSGCLIPLLALLLVLAALLSLWWFFLRPWPQEGTLRDRLESLYKQYLKEDTSAQEALLEQLKAQALLLQQEQEQEQAREQALLEEQKAREEAERKKAEEERLAEALKAQEEAEKARLEALEAQKRAEEEAARLKDEQQKLLEQQKLEQLKLEQQKLEQKRLEQQQAARQAQPARSEPVRADTESTAGKALPKCTTLKQQGKLPKMVVAFDGSESMLARDVNSLKGRQSRLEVATSAANNMVKSIDKNVEIGLVEINGCSAAKNRGFFSGSQRSQLMGTINSINPLRYNGKTPLVDGLNKLADMVDGVNAEAVGVLISDGEDTCDFTQNIDICSLARKIHAKKPKLKIHTILIGKNASKAACVAQITGGKVFSPQNASQINAQLQEAGAEYKKVCKD